MASAPQCSVLGSATPADVVREPFPHIVRQPALDPALYAELAASFPPASLFLGGAAPENNRYYPMPAAKSLADPRVPLIWKEFIRYHVSAASFLEVAALFQWSSATQATPPVALRGAGEKDDLASSSTKIVLDCQFYYCSPVFSAGTTSRAPHVDRPVALYGGLLYFRLAEDRSEGGDLELYRFRGAEREYGVNRAVPPRLIERVKTIPYAANTLVLFANTPTAIHGVSPRAVTRHPRLHINFLAEVS